MRVNNCTSKYENVSNIQESDNNIPTYLLMVAAPQNALHGADHVLDVGELHDVAQHELLVRRVLRKHDACIYQSYCEC